MQPSAILESTGVGGEWSVVHGLDSVIARPHALVGSWRDLSAKNAQAADALRVVHFEMMDRSVELPVSLPGLRAVRATTTSLHTGMKEHYGVGRIEHGDTEWWGGGRVWRSAPGCILVKQPGDVVRHLAHNGPTTFTAVTLPTSDVARVRDEGRAVVIAQLETNDERAAPFHRLIDAVCAGGDRLSLEVALAEADRCLGAHQRRGFRPFTSCPTRDGVSP